MKLPNLPKWQIIAFPVVSIILGVFYFGKYYVADELITANEEIKVLKREVRTMQNLLTEERARSTVAAREADVIRRANNLLRVSDRQRQDEIASLQADLEFYRRLGGANGSQAPLSVHHLELEATQSPRVYRVNLSLTQNLRWASSISGKVQMGVDGILNGVAQHLTNEQLLADSAQPLSFSFKYFQQLECLITLPEGFEATRLIMTLKSSSLRTPVEQSMEWQSLFNQSVTDSPENKVPLSYRRSMIENIITNRHS